MQTTYLTTSRLTLEPIAVRHAPLLAAFFRRNESHLRPWDPPRPRGVTEAGFSNRALLSRVEAPVV